MDESIIDLGNLLLTDPTPINVEEFKKDPSKSIQESAVKNAQKLFDQILTLPKQSTIEGIFVTIPEETTRIPREKKCPPPPKKSKWKEFVEQKGLKFQKKDFWVYDEESDEFRPRVGIGSKEKKEKLWVAEVNEKTDHVDPFGNQEKNKKKKVKKDLTGAVIGKRKREETETNNNNYKRRKVDDLNLLGASALTKKMNSEWIPTFQKSGITKSYEIARVSTASMGKFDKRLGGENIRFNKRLGSKKNVTVTGTQNRFIDNVEDSEAIANRVLKNAARKRTMVKQNLANLFQQAFEKNSMKEKKKALMEQGRARYKIRTKKRGGKRKNSNNSSTENF